MTRVRTVPALTDAQRGQIRHLAGTAQAADGVAPLSEQFLLDLRPGSGAEHVLGEDGADLAGYAQVANPGMPASAAELVVAPAARRRGLGRALLGALPEDARLWAHGDLPEARAFASALGLRTVRELHRMRLRFADVDLPQPRVPDGLTVRTFRPGADDEAWVATNAAAFASHPEQGRLTVADLHQRMAQPWFDPSGFLLVVPADDSPRGDGTNSNRSPAIAAFHWTKAPPAEVYVVGVHPAYQGKGLGEAVTLLGLHHLRDAGHAEVTLYSDGDNVPALTIYRRLGFVTEYVDRMLAFPAVAGDGTMAV